MKIRLLSLNHTRLSLCIERAYVCESPVISLGCDCHPAYVIRSLNLSRHGFPFDWMNTTPVKGIEFINKNIRDGFALFLADLCKNQSGYVVSGQFEAAEFMHYPELIENPETRNKLLCRSQRFLDYYNNRDCLFLFNVTSEGLEERDDALRFIESVKEFQAAANGRHKLLVYIRYDETFQENQNNCNLVEEGLGSLPNTRIAKYIRQKSIHGTWGDEKQYPKLLKSLGVKLRLSFPRIYFSRTER